MTRSYPNRREILSRLGATAAFIGGTLAGVRSSTAQRASLGTIANEKGILFGASFATRELDRPYGAKYADIYEHDARIITSDVEFKLSIMRHSPGVFNVAPAERLCEFALHRQMDIRGHTLIWNDDMPDWIKELSDEEIKVFLERHIADVLTRFRDRVQIWDVVNEPIGPWDRNPGNLRSGPFYRALGEGYIDRSFRVAREHAPDAKLVLNEAQMETNDRNGETFRSSFMALLKRLNAGGTPIDAIGIQSHLHATRPYDYDAFVGFLQEIADMGYELHITELDVNDTGVPGPISARDIKVANMYNAYLDAVLTLPAVKIVQLWGLVDPTSWLRDPETARRIGFRYKARPLIYDEAFQPKRSWYAIERAFNDAKARDPI